MKLFFSPRGLWPASILAFGVLVAPDAFAQMTKSSTKVAAPKTVPQPNVRAFSPLETAFQIPDLIGDPFDYRVNDVRALVRQPDGKTVSLPAFFDGGSTWRVRHAPTLAGRYQLVSLSHNGKPLNAAASAKSWTASAQTLAQFVRIDPKNPRRFVRGGSRYYPLGHNQAWQTGGLPDIPELLGKMGAANENWSRVWMNHWDGKNLDWLGDSSKPGPYGTLSLDVARRWDSIINAAQKNGIAFQLVFQHHGQYSTRVNSNWDINPYSIKNGGFLTTPNEFFTNAQARELTKRKLRYSVARWGYSPSILAWELFNEVQFTDAANDKQWESIIAWHREMASFLREQDVYDHLVTTSSGAGLPSGLWETVDYYQEHTYPADLISFLRAGNSGESFAGAKPYFVGEFGPTGVQDPTGVSLHAGLWAGILSTDSGAPAFWTWDDVERHNLYGHFKAAADFVDASGLALRDNLVPNVPAVSTNARGDLSFGAGGDWGQVKQFEFDVTSSGPSEGIGTLSRYVQGEANRTLGPQPLKFRVNFPQNGKFIIQVGEVSRTGARLKLSVDEQLLVEREFPATPENAKPQGDAARVEVEVPAGQHVVTLENTGSDWVSVDKFVLTDYSPALGAYGLSNSDFFAAWLIHRAGVMAAPDAPTNAVSGELTLPKLKAGRYRATWWDTRAGKALKTEQISVGAANAKLTVPPIARDVALWVAPIR